jgi:hypothetical protein
MVSCGHFVVNSWWEMRIKLAPKNTPTFEIYFWGSSSRMAILFLGYKKAGNAKTKREGRDKENDNSRFLHCAAEDNTRTGNRKGQGERWRGKGDRCMRC